MPLAHPHGHVVPEVGEGFLLGGLVFVKGGFGGFGGEAEAAGGDTDSAAGVGELEGDKAALEGADAALLYVGAGDRQVYQLARAQMRCCVAAVRHTLSVAQGLGDRK